MISIYSLKASPTEGSFNMIPEFVGNNIGKEGYFTLLSVDQEDGREDEFVGIAQFRVNMTVKEMYIAELVYIYVTRNYRFMDAGFKLVQKINEILKSQEVDVIATSIPYNEKGEVISDITEQEIEHFFKECGFITVQDKDRNRIRQFKLTRR